LFKIGKFDVVGNFENGAIIGLSSEGLELVEKIIQKEKIDINLLSEELKYLFETLKVQGFLDDKADKRELPIKATYFHLTQRCNLNCKGCYSHDEMRNICCDLSYAQICDMLKKLKLWGMETIVISGGEPFLRKDIYDILKYIKETLLIQNVQVITNGTISENYKLNLLKKYVDELNVSINGFDENVVYVRDEGIFCTVIGNVERFKKAGINVKMIATTHKKNIELLDKYVDLSKNINVPISFSLLVCSGDYDDFSKWILDEKQLIRHGKNQISSLGDRYGINSPEDFIMQAKEGCGSGNSLISIAYDGAIYPCHMLHVEDLKIGNLLYDDLEKFEENRNDILRGLSVDKIEECNQCEYKYVCGGGCRARAYYAKNNVYVKDPYCAMNKSYYDMIVAKLESSI